MTVDSTTFVSVCLLFNFGFFLFSTLLTSLDEFFGKKEKEMKKM